ncbi:alanyl-tRNA editing protein [Sphaerochaeta sp.]|uniref:alanyl-tRNA editing protein n=1 Tax=Sphaerochaeta sp. TaxID=1972642 RepID=UPI003D14B33E
MHSKPIYYEEPYQRTLQAVVTSITKKGIVLDKTICYPEGGGQAGDRGTIAGKPLLDTIKDDDHTIYHQVENPDFSVGDTVDIVLDWEHRYHYMQMHTAQHVASGLLFHHFSIGTVSVHQGERVLTIETDRKEIPLTVCYALEDLVNQSVREAKPVSYEVHTQQSAQALDLRRSIKVEGDGVRLVVVEDIDTVACGGLHVANTKEIDLFHYEGQEMIRGHVRLIFTIGAIAREEIRGKERIVEQLGALFSSPVEELVETASKAVTQASSDKSALKKCNERLALLELEKRIAGAPGEKGTPVVLWEVEEGLSLKDIGKAATAFENLALCAVQQNGEQVLWLIALVGKAEFLLDFPKQRQNLLSTIAGKGGGKPPLYQGVGTGEGLILLKTFKDLLV